MAMLVVLEQPCSFSTTCSDSRSKMWRKSSGEHRPRAASSPAELAAVSKTKLDRDVSKPVLPSTIRSPKASSPLALAATWKVS
jgi:hypothetical protein